MKKTLRKSLKNWVKWRTGQCDYADGLSQEEIDLISVYQKTIEKKKKNQSHNCHLENVGSKNMMELKS